jgi:hypothetical protein
MNPQHAFYAGAGAALVLAVVAGLMDSRRHRRRDIDATGWVPWRGIQVLLFFAALGCVILSLHV